MDPFDLPPNFSLAHFRAPRFLIQQAETLILDSQTGGKPIQTSEYRVSPKAVLGLSIPLQSESRFDPAKTLLLLLDSAFDPPERTGTIFRGSSRGRPDHHEPRADKNDGKAKPGQGAGEFHFNPSVPAGSGRP